MSRVAIIQARLQSTRFPMKAIAQLHSYNECFSVIENIVAVCKKAKNVDKVCVAVPWNDKHTFETILKDTVKVVGGPEDNVLGRMRAAAEIMEATTVIRITSDCVALMPEGIDAVIDKYELCKSDVNYMCNTTVSAGLSADNPDKYESETLMSDGFNIEVFSIQALREADEHAESQYDREHVTPWIKRNKSCELYNRGFYFIHGKLSLDEWNDLEAIECVLKLQRKGFISYGELSG